MTRVSPLEAHRIWSRTYDHAPNPLLALESRILSGLLGDLTNKRFLDVACGTGRWLRYAQAHGARTLGVDLCPEMLQHAGPSVVLADAARLPLADGIADVVLCAFAAGYMDSPLPEMARIAGPGADLFVTDVHPSALAAGWTRSFRDGTNLYEIDHRPYALADLCAPGLRLENLIEPRFGDPERAIFINAGKPFDSAHPAIFVAHWKKL